MNIESLIDKVLKNKATKEEIQIVENWKAETKANLNALKEMQSLFLESQSLSEYKDFNKKSAWQKIDEAIEYEEVQRRRIGNYKLLSIAAAFVFLLVASFFVFSTISQQHDWIAKSEIQIIDLEDGSKVWLNSNSTLDALGDFENERALSLSGEAYFDVAHLDDKPFTVQVNGIKIEVIGTEFNVKKGAISTQVYVTEGKVKVSGYGESVLLTKGQMLSLNADNFEVYKSGIQDVDQWRTGKLVFRHFPLVDALNEISERYDASFTYDKKAIKNCKLSTSFQNESFPEVLQELKLIFNLDYKIIDRNVDILSINCD